MQMRPWILAAMALAGTALLGCETYYQPSPAVTAGMSDGQAKEQFAASLKAADHLWYTEGAIGISRYMTVEEVEWTATGFRVGGHTKDLFNNADRSVKIWREYSYSGIAL